MSGISHKIILPHLPNSPANAIPLSLHFARLIQDRFVPRKPSRKSAAKSPDIRTVAAVAKVSIATVSRTINGSPLVSERLSKRVWQAIKQLNYFPNSHARTLVSGRSRLFGIIVENITNPFFPNSSAALKRSPSPTVTKFSSALPTAIPPSSPTAFAACSSAKSKASPS